LQMFYLFSGSVDLSQLYRSSYYGHRFELSHPCLTCSRRILCEVCAHCRRCVNRV